MKINMIFARLGVGIMLAVFWGLVDNPLFGVAFFLVLIGLSAVRYRQRAYKMLPVMEIVACVGFAFTWPPALLGLWLPVLGFLEDRWEAMECRLLHSDSQERARRISLENKIDTAARDTQNAARLAELTERSRIAQDIHDHVGHEMHGALIALQTAIMLYEKEDPRTGQQLSQSLKRLESASATLRETVHNLKPAQTIGVEALEEICNGFGFCPIEFSKSGDLSGVAHWELLTANLKELLTNIARHSQATVVNVKINGNESYVRMTVKDNGIVSKSPSHGLGLTGMKDRVRATGGTLSVNTGDGFQVICVLPKK